MKPITVWLVLNGFNKALWDIALSLETAQHRGLQHIRETPLELYWALNNKGNVAAYSLDGESELIEIVQCECDTTEVITLLEDLQESPLS